MLRPACLLPATRLSPLHRLLTSRSGTEISLHYLGPATRRTDAYRNGTLTRRTGAASQGRLSPFGDQSFLSVTTHHAPIIPGGAVHFRLPGESFRVKPPKAQARRDERSNAQAKGLASASSEAFLAGERPARGPTEGASGDPETGPPISQVKRTERAWFGANGSRRLERCPWRTRRCPRPRC